VQRAVHAIGVFEGNIAEALEAIQKRHPDLDIGSYPFYRPTPGSTGFPGGGVALVSKGVSLAEVEEATAEITTMLAAMGATPIQGEPA